MINDNTTEFDFSTEEKDFCCIKMKRLIQENIWKKSGAKNFHEYLNYVRKSAEKTDYWKNAINKPS